METVKIVNGHEIKRAKGARSYDVNIREGHGWREFISFRTIEEAVDFIEKELQPNQPDTNINN